MNLQINRTRNEVPNSLLTSQMFLDFGFGYKIGSKN